MTTSIDDDHGYVGPIAVMCDHAGVTREEYLAAMAHMDKVWSGYRESLRAEAEARAESAERSLAEISESTK